jgi:hypothetical protein
MVPGKCGLVGSGDGGVADRGDGWCWASVALQAQVMEGWLLEVVLWCWGKCASTGSGVGGVVLQGADEGSDVEPDVVIPSVSVILRSQSV